MVPWAKGTAYYKERIYLCHSLFRPGKGNLFNFPQYRLPLLPSLPPPSLTGLFSASFIGSMTCHASQIHFIS